MQDEKKYNYLYKITNLIDNKIYIGIHSTNDLDDGYFGSGKYLASAIEKYKKENFTKIILGFYNTRIELDIVEKTIVNDNFIKRLDTYNLVIGGNLPPSHLGVIRSNEFKQNASVITKNNWKYNEDFIRKQTESWTEERRSNIKLILKEYNTTEIKKQRSEMLIKRFSDPLVVKKHSEALTKAYESQEVRDKQSVSQKLSYKLNPERAKILSNKLKITCNTEEYKLIASNRAKKNWENPNYIENQKTKTKGSKNYRARKCYIGEVLFGCIIDAYNYVIENNLFKGSKSYFIVGLRNNKFETWRLL